MAAKPPAGEEIIITGERSFGKYPSDALKPVLPKQVKKRAPKGYEWVVLPGRDPAEPARIGLRKIPITNSTSK